MVNCLNQWSCPLFVSIYHLEFTIYHSIWHLPFSILYLQTRFGNPYKNEGASVKYLRIKEVA